MDIPHLNIYQRLRDFHVPAAVLDELFSNEDDLKLLIDAWNGLAEENMNGDEIAEEIAATIFRDLNISPEEFSDEY